MTARIHGLTIDVAAILSEEAPWEGTRSLAGVIARTANRNSKAPIGITYNDLGAANGRRIVIGPRGAAAIAVEVGTKVLPAKRPVKRALDKHRVA